MNFIETWRKLESHKYTGIQDVYNWGQYNQARKLQWYIKSQTEHVKILPTTDIQSNKVLKKNSFRFDKDHSELSNHWSFLSLQRYHIKQWGAAIQMTPFRCWPNLPCQQACKSVTILGIAQRTPNDPNTSHQLSRIFPRLQSKQRKQL